MLSTMCTPTIRQGHIIPDFGGKSKGKDTRYKTQDTGNGRDSGKRKGKRARNELFLVIPAKAGIHSSTHSFVNFISFFFAASQLTSEEITINCHTSENLTRK